MHDYLLHSMHVAPLATLAGSFAFELPSITTHPTNKSTLA
jgi:hypothetical protein